MKPRTPARQSEGRFAIPIRQNSDDRFGNVLFYGVVLCLAYFVFRVFQPFLVPLGWAAVFAVIFHSVNKRIELRWGRTFAAVMSTAGVTLILIVPLLLLSMLFVREGIQATRSVQASISTGEFGVFGRAWDWIVSHVAAQGGTFDPQEIVRRNASRVGEIMAAEVGTVVRNTVVFVFELFVMLFALFYFFRDGDAVLARFRLLLPFEEDMREKMLGEARELIFASVTTSLVIAAVQGFICGGAFAIVGLSAAIFWGVVMAFLSLLPVVGAWPVWIPAAIWLFSTGHYGRGLILIGICGGLGSTIDNILRPLILGGRSSLNGLLVFIGVLGGIAVFGVLGIVLGPIVVATAVGFLEAYSGNNSGRTNLPGAAGTANA
ncbi:MAG: AI-2E family transporter [Candidatus Acidiferrales bacterium]